MSTGKYTTIIYDQIYPIIEAAMNKKESKFKDNVSKFFNTNHELVFDIGPYDRIYYTEKDKKALFDSLGLVENDILNYVRNIFYFDMNYNPQCAKEPYVLVLMCIMRFYLKRGDKRNAVFTALYTCFSGKFYASLHGEFFKKFPPSKYRSVMDYVINNMLSAKFDIKSKGNLFSAIQSLCQTYLDTYGEKLQKNLNDEDIGKLIQQLRDRERSFIRNIANLYYEAFENKYYMNYENENLDEDNFRLTTNDANEAARVTEATMNYLTSNYVNTKLCNQCRDSNVKPTEIKCVIENLLSDSKNLPEVKRIINILVCDFKRNYPNEKISSIKFVEYTIKSKPNTKDKYLLEIKSTLIKWLENYSDTYNERKGRTETAISFYRCVIMYFALVINSVAQKF